jgi:hypothetical protein
MQTSRQNKNKNQEPKNFFSGLFWGGCAINDLNARQTRKGNTIRNLNILPIYFFEQKGTPLKIN